MRATFLIGLCVVLGTGFVTGCAHKNAVQAAARAALVQQSNEPYNSRTRPRLAADTNSVAAGESPDGSATNAIGAASANPATSPNAEPAVPVAEVPAATAPTVAAATIKVPAAVAPVTEALAAAALAAEISANVTVKN